MSVRPSKHCSAPELAWRSIDASAISAGFNSDHEEVPQILTWPPAWPVFKERPRLPREPFLVHCFISIYAFMQLSVSLGFGCMSVEASLETHSLLSTTFPLPWKVALSLDQICDRLQLLSFGQFHSRRFLWPCGIQSLPLASTPSPMHFCQPSRLVQTGPKLKWF